MGIAIPQVVAEDRASGAQVIDGSIVFDRSKLKHLKKTISTTGNQKTFTVSFWFKKQLVGNLYQYFFTTEYLGTGNYFEITSNSDQFHVYGGNGVIDVKITRKLRDTDGWIHAVVSIDSTIATPVSDRVKIYLNGERQEDYVAGSSDFPPQNHLFTLEGSRDWYIGTAEFNGTLSSSYYDGHMSNFYFVDGQALGPEEFGFTDPLTNTWRPKKYTGTFGTNGFWLPMDGNSPIGEDKSDNSNINDGTIWSNDVTTSNAYSANRDPGKGFDGNSSLVGQSDTYVQSDNSSGTVTWTPNGYTIDTADEILVKGISSLDRLSVVGSLGSQSNIAPATVNGITNVYTIPTNLGTLTSLTVTGNSSLAGWSGISVGGILLVNGLKGNSWTPVNFSGSSAIDKATGALPILNTVNGGRSATVGVRTDAFANNLILALPLVDTTTDASGIINSGTTSKTITAYNNAAPASDGQGNFYDVSLYLDGTDDYVETSNSDDFVVGTGDFTIEAWYNVAATQGTNSRLFAQNVNDDNNWDCYLGGSYGTSDIMMHGGTVDLKMSFPTANAWHHFCIVRKNGTLYSFMNGVLRHTQTYTNSVGANNHGFRVGVIGGSGGSTGYGLQGYVQDFRFYKGVAKYTSDFIPASTNPDILPDTPSGVSGGSKLAKITDGAVSFDGTGDSLSIADSADFTFGSGDFTMEAFVYCNNASTVAHKSIIMKYTTDNASSSWFWSVYSGLQYFYFYYGSDSVVPASTTILPDKKWTHCAVVRDGNTLRIFQDGIQVQTADVTGFTINDSSVALTIGEDGQFNYDINGFISNARVIKGTALYTSNFTPPTAPLTNVTNTKLLCCQSVAEKQNNFIRMFLSDTLYTTKADILANATEVDDGESGISNKYWYIVPTGTEPIGSDVFTNDGSVTTPHGSNHFALYWRNGSSWTQTIGTYGPSEYSDFDYKSDDSSSTYSVYPARDFYVFGADDSPSEPKLISGTLPTRAKYYKFDGAVKPGTITANGNVAATNFNPFTTDINAVRGQETGYCTWNPLTTPTNTNYSDGNLTINKTGTSHSSSYATMGMTTGKWYWEISKLTSTADGGLGMGLVRDNQLHLAASTSGTDRYLIYLQSNIIYYYDGYATGLNFTSTAAFNDNPGTFMFAFDADNQKLYFGKDGSWTNGASGLSGGNPSIGSGPLLDGFNAGETYFPWCTPFNSGQNMGANFGQKPFKYAPPAGFQPLNAANVRPETVIVRPDQYVGVTTYTGNGGTRTISELNHKPDLVWLKSRTSGGSLYTHNVLIDSVRGATSSGYRNLYPNLNVAEYAPADVPNSSVTSLNANGFDIGGNANTNYNTATYVAWCWKAGGNKNTFNVDDVGYASAAAAGLTAGTITPTGASVGTKQGFSIVTYNSTGSSLTLDHGLSQKPDFFIFKCTSHDQHWGIGHSYDYNDELYFDTNEAGSSTTSWGSGPDNNVFTLGTSDYVNTVNREYICYSWHDVPGLQKFGSFTGNADANGPFIELGFRPAIIWVKRTGNGTHDGTNNGYSWVVQDSERQKYNPVDEYLLLNSNNQFGSGFGVDFLSNGFKIRNSNGNMNGTSTPNYLYCAWAEAPSVNLYGGQSNAR